MATTIRFKRGLEQDFSSVVLKSGEPAFVLDTGKLYVGNGTESILINPTYGTAADKDTGTGEGDIPVLGPDGKLPADIIPASAMTEVFVVQTKAEMLALDANVGDIAIVTDDNETYILKETPASNIDNWVPLEVKSAVTSVAGKTGDVVLTVSDIEGLAADLTGLMPKAGGVFTGPVYGVTGEEACDPKLIPTVEWVRRHVIDKSPVKSVAGKVGVVTLEPSDIIGLDGALNDKADLDSPEFTGTPTTPNVSDSDPNTTIVNKKYVDDKVLAGSPVKSVNTLTGAVVLGGADILLTDYEKGEDKFPILATDSVNAAFGKVEKEFEVIDGGSFTA